MNALATFNRCFLNRGLTRLSLKNTLPFRLSAQYRCLKTSQVNDFVSTNSFQAPIKTVGIRKEDALQPSRLARVWDKIKWKTIGESVMLRSSYHLYEECVDSVDYLEFFKEFNMSDTFLSWFLVTELHVWMCQVRVMVEEKEGRFVRNKLTEAMWADIAIRITKLGNVTTSAKKEGLDHLQEHFHAALFSYDEGLLSDDKILAGALWRIFFSYECSNVQHLETLVHYVRMQINHLDFIPKEVLFKTGKVNWIPLHKAKETL